MKDFFKKYKNIIIIFVVSIIIMLPMFLNKYHSGHDTQYHVLNIINLAEQIKNNFLSPSSIVGEIANNFGYGTEMFYPPLSHTFAAYIQVITNNISITMKLTHFIVIFLSGISMYFLSKRLSKNENIALTSAIIYMTFPYFLSNTYVRDSLAECFIFIFLPMILSGIYELFKGNKNKFYLLFTLGYVGGILSHLTMMIYFTVLLGIYLIMKYKYTLKNIVPFIISSCLVLFITSPFLITLLEHKLLGNYAVFVPGIMSQGIQWGGLLVYDYLFGKSSDGINFFINIVVIVLLVITIIKYKKINKKEYKFLIIFLISCMFIATKIFPWDLLPQSFRIIQFPWRFEIFISILISLLAPLCLKLYKEKITYLFILLIVITSIFEIKFANENILNVDDLWKPLGMGWQKEYLPYNTWNNTEYFDARSEEIIIKSGEGSVSNVINDVPNLKFTITGDVVIELPRLYYLTYKLESNGKTFEYYENENGFIEAKLSSGTYTLSYSKTKLGKICTFISLSSIIVLVVCVRRKYEKD